MTRPLQRQGRDMDPFALKQKRERMNEMNAPSGHAGWESNTLAAQLRHDGEGL